eukprot:TRINITY_DN14878_c0_g1_i3.p1 TRINITY_DN14878_c0_g1~~TRINITY_DN14878_c0_g1_i3.p1  ORF type:complete len:1385 (-),score=314.30 TRINITY_DN14878_c0_g1_i3:79-3888(-)
MKLCLADSRNVCPGVQGAACRPLCFEEDPARCDCGNKDFRAGVWSKPLCSALQVEAQEEAGSGVFDCQEDLEAADRIWSDKKRQWCCGNKKLGCSSAPGGAAPTQAPPLVKPSRVDSLAEMGAAVEYQYNCQGELQNWRNAWPDAKKAWCCEHQKLGCEDKAADSAAKAVPAPAATSEPAKEMSRQPAALQQKSDAAAPSTQQQQQAESRGYDCEGDAEHWRTAWPAPKQKWCCQNRQVGCADEAASLAQRQTVSRRNRQRRPDVRGPPRQFRRQPLRTTREAPRLPALQQQAEMRQRRQEASSLAMRSHVSSAGSQAHAAEGRKAAAFERRMERSLTKDAVRGEAEDDRDDEMMSSSDEASGKAITGRVTREDDVTASKSGGGSYHEMQRGGRAEPGEARKAADAKDCDREDGRRTFEASSESRGEGRAKPEERSEVQKATPSGKVSEESGSNYGDALAQEVPASGHTPAAAAIADTARAEVPSDVAAADAPLKRKASASAAAVPPVTTNSSAASKSPVSNGPADLATAVSTETSGAAGASLLDAKAASQNKASADSSENASNVSNSPRQVRSQAKDESEDYSDQDSVNSALQTDYSTTIEIVDYEEPPIAAGDFPPDDVDNFDYDATGALDFDYAAGRPEDMELAHDYAMDVPSAVTQVVVHDTSVPPPPVIPDPPELPRLRSTIPAVAGGHMEEHVEEIDYLEDYADYYMREQELHVGGAVLIAGLLQNMALNGQRGVLGLPMNDTAGRWRVTLKDGSEVGLLGENLIPQEELFPGHEVFIHSLLADRYLNGQHALVESFNPAAGRWRVRLDGGQDLMVRPENLRSKEHALLEHYDIAYAADYDWDYDGRATPLPLPLPLQPEAPPHLEEHLEEQETALSSMRHELDEVASSMGLMKRAVEGLASRREAPVVVREVVQPRVRVSTRGGHALLSEAEDDEEGHDEKGQMSSTNGSSSGAGGDSERSSSQTVTGLSRSGADSSRVAVHSGEGSDSPSPDVVSMPAAAGAVLTEDLPPSEAREDHVVQPPPTHSIEARTIAHEDVSDHELPGADGPKLEEQRLLITPTPRPALPVQHTGSALLQTVSTSVMPQPEQATLLEGSASRAEAAEDSAELRGALEQVRAAVRAQRRHNAAMVAAAGAKRASAGRRSAAARQAFGADSARAAHRADSLMTKASASSLREKAAAALAAFEAAGEVGAEAAASVRSRSPVEAARIAEAAVEKAGGSSLQAEAALQAAKIAAAVSRAIFQSTPSERASRTASREAFV